MIGRNASRQRILERPSVGSIGSLQQNIAACSSRTPSRRASLMCLTAAMIGMALLLAACAPALNHVRLSKHPELVSAINKPSRPTDYPQHVIYGLPDMDRVLLASELPFATENSINLLVDIYYPPLWRSTLDHLIDCVPALVSAVKAKPSARLRAALTALPGRKIFAFRWSSPPPKWTIFSPPPTSGHFIQQGHGSVDSSIL